MMNIMCKVVSIDDGKVVPPHPINMDEVLKLALNSSHVRAVIQLEGKLLDIQLKRVYIQG